ncbi:MAG: DUF2310 family Zn-ribbon-containing protein [Phycisphaerae bacterium]|nr:DUF2310 family Zn-ribbon-containing protein [Phycisphaerae bacterium]
MDTAELTFKKRKGRDQQAALDAIDNVLYALRRSGQLVEQDAPVAQVRGGYRVFVSLPEANSLQPRFRTQGARNAMRGLRKAGVTWEGTRVLGPDPESDPVCTCHKPGTLILTTHFLSCESPLQCGDCRGVVPLYRVPPIAEYGDYEDARFWTYHYQAFDSIWIASGAGERFAYRQLATPDSELSMEGRDVCRRIEAGSGIPTYYHLLRQHGRSRKAERKRKCPGCGGEWLLGESWLGLYDFRCDPCRLVSETACDVQ